MRPVHHRGEFGPSNAGRTRSRSVDRVDSGDDASGRIAAPNPWTSGVGWPPTAERHT